MNPITPFDSSRYQQPEPNFATSFLGVGYGCILLVLGIAAAGMGHGTYVLLGLASSPLPLLTTGLGIIGAPLLWGAIGLAFACRARPWGRRALLGLLASHYIGLWPVLTGEFGDWSHLAKVWRFMPVALALGGSVYLMGQAAIWTFFLRVEEDARQHQHGRFQFTIRRMLISVLFIGIALACFRAGNPHTQALGVAAAAVAVVILTEPRADRASAGPSS